MDVTWCTQRFLDVSLHHSDWLSVFSPSCPPPHPSSFSSSSFWSQYRYQDDDSPPPEHGFPRLTNEVRAPELVHVSEKNLSEIENVHGYVSHSHISPLKVSYFPHRSRHERLLPGSFSLCFLSFVLTDKSLPLPLSPSPLLVSLIHSLPRSLSCKHHCEGNQVQYIGYHCHI